MIVAVYRPACSSGRWRRGVRARPVRCSYAFTASHRGCYTNLAVFASPPRGFFHATAGSLTVLALLLATPVIGRAGLYYSGEVFAELPSQWRGFLLDHRTLRQIGVQPKAGASASPARVRYLDELAKLEKLAKQEKLSADQLADLVLSTFALGN